VFHQTWSVWIYIIKMTNHLPKSSPNHFKTTQLKSVQKLMPESYPYHILWPYSHWIT
jgi:hypothetical protein